jgi:hypothetical protein
MNSSVQRLSSGWAFKIGVALLITFLAFQFANLNSATASTNSAQDVVLKGCSPDVLNNSSASVTTATTSMSLAPGELPGYTGWARPEHTLAPHFAITSISSNEPHVGEELIVTIRCRGHEDCAKGTSLFFLRAYGPSVISGIAVPLGGGSYQMKFLPMDPGSYTVEVVISFSDSPAFEKYPLWGPSYEGYPLPGFPLQMAVQGGEEVKTSDAYCSFEHLTEDSSASAVTKARWRVESKSNGPGYQSGTLHLPISPTGYNLNFHSLGIHMNLEYRSGCKILPRSAFFNKAPGNPFLQCRERLGSDKKLQVIFIGDSVMKLQKAMFDGMVRDLPNVQTYMIELYGGYRRCEKKGPNFKAHLKDIQRRQPDDPKVILFNTGLHDIHRLCGQEWTDDRYEYLDKATLDSKTFRCTEEYRVLLEEFASEIQRFPADLRIFQSTTAAWPKYGNFGIDWPITGGQNLPLAPDAVSRFNEIAFGVFQKYRKDIQIMDGYWITYARPDNREIGTTGKKLSHPGLEVQSAMTSIWSMLILNRVCGFS